MGAVFGFFAGFYYWIEKMVGVSTHEKHSSLTINDMVGFETLGYVHFFLMFLGVNITFFPMHFLGLAGMPRRIPDYPDSFQFFNSIASYGSIVSVVAVFVFFYIIYVLIRDRAQPTLMYKYFN